MSFRLVDMVFDHGPGDPSARMVLLALVRHIDERKGWLCWPSRDALVRETALSRATVGRALRWLEREGWLQRSKRYQSSAVFRVNGARLVLAMQAKDAKPDVPDGFDAFPEEIELASRAAQAIENKDKAHSEPQKAHNEPQKAHSEHVISKEPIKKPSGASAPKGSDGSVLPQKAWEAYWAEKLAWETRQAWLDRCHGGVLPAYLSASAEN